MRDYALPRTVVDIMTVVVTARGDVETDSRRASIDAQVPWTAPRAKRRDA